MTPPPIQLMTPAQESHLLDLKYEFIKALDAKYRSGASEHKGDLLSMTVEQLVDEAIYENIDQITYLLTLKAKLNTKT